MNDTPGWASPGSAPSDGNDPDRQGSTAPEDQPSGPPSKWSKEQPPPAQWSAPGAPGPGQTPPPPAPPGQGWGGGPAGGGGQGGGPYRGWGAWQGPPAAAKPGVIPLRPLAVGEILDGAVSTMRTHWRTVLGISLTVAVVTELVVVLLQGLVLNDADTSALDDPDATVGELTRALGDTLLSSGVVLVVTLLGTIVATALLTMVTSRAVLGRSVTTAEAWHDSRPQLPKLLGLTLLLPLIAVGIVVVGVLPGVLIAAAGATDGGAALAVVGGLAAGVVAIWLMVRLSLSSPALMLEKQGVKKSLSRSVKLVRRSWWRVFGIQLLAAVIANVISSIVVIPFTVIAGALSGDSVSNLLDSASGDVGWVFLIVSGIGQVIGSMLTFPITAGVTVLLYIDQRIRREALDLELARAAGVPGHGTPDAPGTPGS
ncbi:glycerophosphoryl diester phosphodiesterase membrane domain-containing protein [Streptomyces sp. PmtG]